MIATRNGRQLYKWVARYRAPGAFGGFYEPVREIMAVNEFQANKKAEGIAKKDGWKLISLGRA